MRKVKFRVYQDRYCTGSKDNRGCAGACGIYHPFPTDREICYQSDGTEEEVTQRGWRFAVKLLERESNHLRPLYQYIWEI